MSHEKSLERPGPSDRIRTCGIVVPNHARYQLRYTRISLFYVEKSVFIISDFKICVKGEPYGGYGMGPLSLTSHLVCSII